MALHALRVSLMVALLVPAAGLAQTPPGGASVVVISSKAKGGPNLAPQVKKLLEKPLGKQAKVVPLATYQKAAKRLGVKGAAITAPESAGAIGSEAGVTHVIFVEGQLDKEKIGKKTKQTTYAMVKVIEVATGDVIFTSRYELKAKKIDAKIGGLMVTEITGAMTKPAVPPPAPSDNPSPAPPEAPPPPPDATAPGGTSPPPPESPPPPAGTAGGAEPAPAPVAPEPAPAEPAPVIAALSAPPTGETSLTAPDTSTRRKRWRPALHVGLGGIGMQRSATIKVKGGLPPGYKGPLPGGIFQLAFYPLAINGNGSMVEGIGLFAEGSFMRVETVVDDHTKQAATSDVVGASGGLAYRLVFWDSERAPDFTLKVGYNMLQFPLKDAAFPSTRYGMLTGGGAFTIPFVRQVALVIGGAYEQRLAVGLKAKTKLGKVSSQMGFRGEGGVRLFFDPIEIRLFGRFEQFNSKFKGSVKLTPTQPQPYTDMTLTDRYIGGFGTVGVAF